MMEYKGYLAEYEIDLDAKIIHGSVVNTKDVITFQAEDVGQLESEFHTSVDEYLDFCAERGEEPERPFSGKLALRLPTTLHRDVFLAANKAGESINAWIVSSLAHATASQQGTSSGSAPRFDWSRGQMMQTALANASAKISSDVRPVAAPPRTAPTLKFEDQVYRAYSLPEPLAPGGANA